MNTVQLLFSETPIDSDNPEQGVVVHSIAVKPGKWISKFKETPRLMILDSESESDNLNWSKWFSLKGSKPKYLNCYLITFENKKELICNIPLNSYNNILVGKNSNDEVCSIIEYFMLNNGFSCDGCETRLENIYYHCATCGFDQCEGCFTDINNHLLEYPEHKCYEESILECETCMELVDSYYRNLNGNIICSECCNNNEKITEFNQRVSEAFCDKCFKQIKVLGYSCDSCENFDICPSCYILGSKTTDFHDLNHTFTIRTVIEDGSYEEDYKTFYEKYYDNANNEETNKETNKEIKDNSDNCIVEI